MRNRYFLGKSAAIFVVAFSFLAVAAERTVFAQRARTAAVERRIELLNRQAIEEERQSLYREMKGGKNKSVERVRTLKLEQIKKDFEKLQNGYNLILIAISAKPKSDRDAILSHVSEVNKCASRLKKNLALPNPKPDEEKNANEIETDSNKSADELFALEKSIYSFVTNPIFEAPAVLDVEQATKARRDLDKIIRLSESIKSKPDK